MSVKIIGISDSHSHPLKQIIGDQTADVLAIAGDWSYKAAPKEVFQFEEDLNSVRDQFLEICWINGNHELGLEDTPSLSREIAERTRTHYLEDSGVTFNIRGEEIKIWGSPITPYFGGWAYNRRRGAEIRRHWEMIPEGLDLLITHGPAHRTNMDYLNWSDEYVGCEDLREVLVDMLGSPKYHISGHIHIGAGKKFMLRTNHDKIIQCMNVAICNETYEPVNPPTIFYI